ncbi:MAG: phosphatase PAP2 family protein [Ilumatobacteraceae bacterium]
MSTTVAVLLVSLLAGVALVVIGRLHGTKRHPDDVIDPQATEHWLVERVENHPRLRRVLSTMDQRVIGGAAVATSFVVLFAAALIVGAVFDTVDTTRGFARWDQSVSQWGPDHATTAAATFLRQLTHLGATGYLLILMAIVGVIDWNRRRNVSSLLFLLTVGVGVMLINNGLKLLIMRERPPGAALLHPAGSSFPSGHSAAAAACWLGIALVVGRWVRPRFRPYISAAAVGIACMVATSRALLGVHWLTDVIAGVFVGWAWFMIVAIAFGGRNQELGQPVEQVAKQETEQPMPEHEMTGREITKPKSRSVA